MGSVWLSTHHKGGFPHQLPTGRRMRTAREHLATAAEHAAQQAQSLDLFAEELRLAQEALNSITGAFSSDDLLGVIFSRFCIGK